MAFKFNPFTGTLDEVGAGGAASLFWLDAVPNEAALPSGDTDGAARVVLDQDAVYVYDSGNDNWTRQIITIGAFSGAGNASGLSLANADAGNIRDINLILHPATETEPGGVSIGVQTFGGNKTFSDDVIVGGDLTVNGTTTTINTQTLDVTDANISVNVGGNQSSADTNDAGLTVTMTDATNAIIGYDSTLASRFLIGDIGSESEIIGAAFTQTLTNKTIDADQNTITNIENADIKAGAAIDAAKIADGTVTNTEFQFINTLTSNAQDQFDARTVGPASATDNALVRFDTTTGKLVQNSGAILDDADALQGLTQLIVDDITVDGNSISSSTTEISVNSNKIIDLDTPVNDTDAANKSYVDEQTAGVSSAFDNIVIANVQAALGNPANAEKVCPVGTNTPSSVVAINDGTIVNLNDSFLTSINAGETFDFNANAGDRITANKATYVNSDDSGMVAWPTLAFAGTDFYYNSTRNAAPQRFFIATFAEDASVELFLAGVSQGTTVIPRSSTQEITNTGTGEYRLTSDAQITVYALGDNNTTDSTPIPPLSSELLWWSRTVGGLGGIISVVNANTTITYTSNTGITASVLVQPNAPFTLPFEAAGFDPTSAAYIIADGPISGYSNADGDGSNATAWLPPTFAAKNFTVPYESESVAFVSRFPGTVTVKNAAGVTQTTLTLSRTGGGDSPYATIDNTVRGRGFRYECSVPCNVVYDSDTATNNGDETHLFGANPELPFVLSVNDKVSTVQLDAVDIPYDPSGNTLTATDTQGAIDELAGFISAGDLSEGTFALAQSQTDQDVTGLTFANGTVRGAKVEYTLTIDATADLFEKGTLELIQRTSDWALSQEATGDNSLISFSVTAAGQIQYTSPAYAGFTSGTMKFRATALGV